MRRRVAVVAAAMAIAVSACAADIPDSDAVRPTAPAAVEPDMPAAGTAIPDGGQQQPASTPTAAAGPARPTAQTAPEHTPVNAQGRPLLPAAEDGGTPGPAGSAPHGQGGEALIAVPAAAPGGRCAPLVPAGVDAWEACAWSGYGDDSAWNYPLTDSEAEELLAVIWAEVDVHNKRRRPPTSSLLPAGAECASVGPIGCFRPNRHHIDRSDALLRTLLHETAHALVIGHPTVTACTMVLDHDAYSACAHNDIFRCAADHLYAAYAGIPSAGVCGAAQPPHPPDKYGAHPGPSAADRDTPTAS